MPALQSVRPLGRRRAIHSNLPISELAWLSIIAFSIVSACFAARSTDRNHPAVDASRAPLANVEAKAAALAGSLAADCPFAAAAERAAFEACRKRLHISGVLRQSLGGLVLWGRHDKERPLPLADTDLTQLAPSTLAGTYLPLFAFDGGFALGWNAGERLWRVELVARWRNRGWQPAPPGPLRREDDLEAGLELTQALVLWLEPDARAIFAVQAVAPTPPPPLPAAVAGSPVPTAAPHTTR